MVGTFRASHSASSASFSKEDTDRWIWAPSRECWPLVLLAREDRRGVLRRTLNAWFAASGHAVAAAHALHVHRNTLEYRLRRIREVTGLNPAVYEEGMMLYIALQLE